MCYKMYAISYYGERYKFGYIQMDFLDCYTVEHMVNEPKNNFWKEVKVISADVPYPVYTEYIGEKKRTLEDGSLFIVTLAENGKESFDCQMYFGNNTRKLSRISIVNSEKCDNEKRNLIVDALNYQFDITTYDSLATERLANMIHIVKNKKYTFKVHNVGQALATSIQSEDNPPFLYFDYGWNLNPTKRGFPVLGISENETVIFLSHADEDHWCGSFYNNKSLKCPWIVPKQNGKAAYQKFLNDIISCGGNVYWHDKNIDMKYIHIGNDKVSKIKKTRLPKPTHQDGYALYINAYTILNGIENNYKITVCGDQDYDYQEPNRYNESNVLVACHHGGDYCWSKRFGGIFPATDDSVVVYSYGFLNSYNHPTKTNDYINWGWKVRHDTPNDGSFEKDIYFK